MVRMTKALRRAFYNIYALASSAECPGFNPSQGPRHTKDVIKMVPVVPLFSTEHSKGKILALSQELR